MAMEKKTWDEFQSAGLLWFVNRILHIFGWAIVINCEDDGTVSECYPARVPYRGFEPATEEENFEKVARFMRDNAKALYEEAKYVPPKEKETP